MTIAFPTSGNYIDYADRWVDPALAFGAGFAEWLGQNPHQTNRFVADSGTGWTSIVASEAAFFNILIQFWGNGDFPKAASRKCEDPNGGHLAAQS